MNSLLNNTRGSKVEATELPQTIDGQVTTADNPFSITEVLLTPAWKLGYRIGTDGPIFADRSAAVRFAVARKAKANRLAVA